MDLETLKTFCEEEFESIRKPWTDGAFTYTSDGRLIVRLPGELTEKRKGPPGATKLNWHILGKKQPDLKITREEVLRIKETKRCENPYQKKGKETGKLGDCGPDCPECGGTGWNFRHVWQLGDGLVVSPQYLEIITERCGEIDIYLPMVSPDMYSPVRFRFHGGDGLLMPMRVLGLQKIVNEAGKETGVISK